MSDDSAERNNDPPIREEKRLEQREEEEVQAEQVLQTSLEVTFFNVAKGSKEILALMAEGCSVEDFRNFRLASKSFYKVSLKTWRRKVVLRVDFTYPSNNNRDDDDNPMNKLLTLDEAIRLTDRNEQLCFLNLQQYPYRGIHIYNCICLYDDYEDRDQLITELFKRMNPVLNHIVLDSCGPMDSFHTLQKLSEVTNLNSVVFKNSDTPSPWGNYYYNEIKIMAAHLTIDPLSNEGRHAMVEEGTWGFFNHFPVLQTFTLHLTSLVRPANRAFIQGLSDYRDKFKNNSLRLKIVGLTDFEGTISEFLEATIPIEQWAVSYIESDFLDLLRKRSRRLVKLSLDKSCNDFWDPAFLLDLELPSLTELYLFGNLVTSFNFSRFMPALEKLVVIIYDPEELSMINSTPEENRNDNFVKNMPENVEIEMKNLTYLDIDCYLDLDGLVVLHRKAPGLTVLRTALRNNEMFGFVCENWKMLTDLTLYPGSAVDDVEIPKLTSLENLISFKIWNSRMLTDASVHNSFLRLKRLQELCVYCSTTNISENCKELLKTHIRKVKFAKGGEVPHRSCRMVFEWD